MMLKQFGSYILMFILMVSTIGVNVSVQWCGDEWTGVDINGIQFLTEAGQAMKGSCCPDDDEDGCHACHHVSHKYQITSQYVGGQTVNVLSAWHAADWQPCVLPQIQEFLFTVEEGSDSAAGFYHSPPCHDDAACSRRGLRAPPVLA